MRRRIVLIAFTMLFAVALPVAAQEHGEAEAEHASTAQADYTWWKWANFVLLAAGLGYLIGKHAPGYFHSRRDEIQEGLITAQKLSAEAESKTRNIEQRMASLGAEIEKMRESARAEIAHEGDRVNAETTTMLAKIQAQAEQDIASAAKGARQELKEYAAGLAVSLAEQRIRERLTPQTQDALVDAFVQDLRKRTN